MKNNYKKRIPISSLTVLSLVFLTSSSVRAQTLINGSGATFPYPLYSKWISEYKKSAPQTDINYQSVGSGAGIRQLIDRTVDFAASDAPMTDEQLAKAGDPVLHIPTALGAVVLSYQIPNLSAPLVLDGPVVADLFLGKITKWNDPRIQALNPGVSLPSLPVLIVHRSDGSGTTAIFVDYLAKVSAEWKAQVGVGTAVKWPTGLGGKGNEGVTGVIKQTPGSLGYVELVYAKQNHLAVASIKNAAGKTIIPSVDSVTAAAAGALATIPSDFRVSITQASGAGAYPISGMTYLLVRQNMGAPKSDLLKGFLNWALNEGQKLCSPLDYAPLPASLVKRVKAKIALVK